MRQKHLKKATVLLVIALLIFMLSLSSCGVAGPFLDLYIEKLANENSLGNHHAGSSGDQIEEGAIVRATAKGLRSAVSVYCSFESKEDAGNEWLPWGEASQSYYSVGSGVLYRVTADGSAFVITNHHVVYDGQSKTEDGISDEIVLFLYGMENQDYAIPATYVGGSVNYDLAVLRVEQSEILKKAVKDGSAAAITVGDSNKLTPGMTTFAIGNPSTGGISVTQGIVSVDSEYITMTANDNSGEISFRVIRTDTPVNSGNSGGGLFNTNGDLVGIVNAKIISDDVENIGYALPSSLVRAVTENIIDHCYQKDCKTVRRALLGITVITAALSTEYDPQSGMLVRHEEISVHAVNEGSLGARILQEGDILKSITVNGNTTSITRQHHVIEAMLDAREGSEISVKIIRGNNSTTVKTTITAECLAAY